MILLVLCQSVFCFAPPSYAVKGVAPKPKPKTEPQKGNLVKQKATLDSPSKESKMPPVAPSRKQSTKESADSASYLEQIKKLEQVMFADRSAEPGGKAGNGSLSDRVSRLEQALFGETSPKSSIPERLKKLQESLFGSNSPSAPISPTAPATDDQTPPPNTVPPTVNNQMPGVPPDLLDPGRGGNWTDNTLQPKQPEYQVVESFLNQPDSLKSISSDEMKLFGIYVINAERQARGLSPVEADAITDNLAKAHITDLTSRKLISHTDIKGKNPDQRLTELGGADACEECLASITTGNLSSSELNKMVAASLIKMMLERQDDREALFNPDATHLSIQFAPSSDGSEILSCAEVLTRKGTYEAIPKEVSISEDIKVEGTLDSALAFDRITLAYEELNEVPIEEDPSAKEALPYFPPLDFIAYRKKSEKDYSKLIIALKGLGVVAAIAGGVFMPPVALAAPLIIMAGPSPMGGGMKPQSDIPIKGGVKVKGSNFSAKVSISNEDKPGIYYVTVWAISGNRSIPVSRRTVTARLSEAKKDKEETPKIEYTENVEAKEEPSQDATK